MVQDCSSISLKFADLSLKINCNNQNFISQISKDFSTWKTDTVSHLCITLKLQPPTRLPGRSTKVRCFQRKNGVIITHSGIRIYYCKENCYASIHLSNSTLLFSRAIRILLSLILPEYKGILIHSSSVILPGDCTAYIFLGQSGAGKTTVSKLLKNEECQISNDELSIVRQTSDGWKLFPSPFGGDLKSECTFHNPVALYGLNTLIKAVRPDIIPLSQPVAFVSLLRCIVNFYQDTAHQNRLFEVAHHLVNEIPSSALYFRKDEKVLPLICKKKEAA